MLSMRWVLVSVIKIWPKLLVLNRVRIPPIDVFDVEIRLSIVGFTLNGVPGTIVVWLITIGE